MMSVFKQEREIKRMIFNVYSDTAESIEALKEEARGFGKRLDVDTAVNKALEKFVSKASKKMEEMRREAKGKPAKGFKAAPGGGLDLDPDAESGQAL